MSNERSGTPERRGPGVRAVARDGALLFFDRRDGANVLLRGASTRQLRARAPRVVMFGITNACNLRCTFCSRDVEAASSWDEESAFALLSALSRMGVLEVALGGGEPLAFRGIERLLARLDAETSLAVHLTTNATLLDGPRLDRIRPHVGEIRVSIYDDNPWPERIAALAEAGGSFGANVLVTPERIDLLPLLLRRLEDLGCPDVALLRYVGPDAALALDPTQATRVGAIARGTSMRVRASVCFGDALALPMLAPEQHGDCGAGADFVVVTSDRQVRACSFASDGVPITSAEDVIEVWRRERARLGARVEFHGCARDAASAREEGDGLRAWRAFSGNNSGDCFLVGKFATASEAEALRARLNDGYAPGERFSAAWNDVLDAEGVTRDPHALMPESLEVVGRTLIAHTGFAAADDFPPLRALIWKLGGAIVASGVHEHDPVHIVSALAIDDPRAREALDVRAAVDDLEWLVEKGEVLYGIRETSDLREDIAIEREVIAGRGIASAELIAMASPPPLARALARSRPSSEQRWLVAYLWPPEHAAPLARELGPNAAECRGTLIVGTDRIPSRVALRVSRAQGVAHVIECDEVALDAWFSETRPEKTKSRERLRREGVLLESELRAELGELAWLAAPMTEAWRSLRITLHTRDPLAVLRFLDAFAKGRNLAMGVGVRSTRPLEHALARLDVDLAALRRERSRS